MYTTSFRAPEEGFHFSSRSGESYTLQKIPPRAIGTRVVLSLSPQFKELANPRTVRALLERYCCLLTVPIYAGDKNEPPIPLGPRFQSRNGSCTKR